MTSHPGSYDVIVTTTLPSDDGRMKSGLLDDVTDTIAHPGSLTDSTIMTVDLAAGQDVQQVL